MTVTDSSAISMALARLYQSISDMNTHAASDSTTSTARTTLLNRYDPATPFQISYLAGSTIYAYACALLSKLWYGKVKPSLHSFPTFAFAQTRWNGTPSHLMASYPSPQEEIPITILSPNISQSTPPTLWTNLPLVPTITPFKTLRPPTPCSKSSSQAIFAIPYLSRCKNYVPMKTALHSSSYSFRSPSSSTFNSWSSPSTKSRSSLRRRKTTTSPQSTPISTICSCLLTCPTTSSTM